ncbi:ATP-binding protein [Streptomyces sp. KR80]|uniref:ATP-binding protein n=1 Tax=Streptomyces sp. KR80 TaxID=3457426 RepID=UPI003FD34475
MTHHPTEPRQARQLTRHVLVHWALPEHCETAELLVSEIVTNALTHGNGPVRLYLRCWHGTLRFEVTDCCASIPQIRPLSPDSEEGRGLHLLEVLARQWGVRGLGDGKIIWFELATCAVRGCCRP